MLSIKIRYAFMYLPIHIYETDDLMQETWANIKLLAKTDFQRDIVSYFLKAIGPQILKPGCNLI